MLASKRSRVAAVGVFDWINESPKKEDKKAV
jgi:hypothetical protein